MLINRPIRAFAALLLAWFVIYALFRDFPGLDIAFAKLFYFNPECPGDSTRLQCGVFALGRVGVLSAIRTVLFYLPAVLAIAMLAWSIKVSLSREEKRLHKARLHNIRILLATWIIDVFLIVNLIFKANSGRPRPELTDLFGGDWSFRAVGDFTGQCVDNCSFVSGEAASAGWLVCTLAILPPAWRRRLTIPVTLLAVLTALLRVAFGRHYLSDALLGFLSAPVVFMFLIMIFGWKNMEQKTR